MNRRPRDTATDVVPLSEATRAWFSISLRTFGGPAGQIAVMHRELVDDRRWVGEQRFLHALSFCTLLPGPEAQQLAIYLGWLLNGNAGGLIAGTLFVLPGFLSIMALSLAYVRFGDSQVVAALFAGIAPAVLAIVAQALLRVGRRALKHRGHVAIALSAFVALFAFAVPFAVVVIVAALVGFAGGWVAPRMFVVDDVRAAGPLDGSLVADSASRDAKPTVARMVRFLMFGVVMWAVPVVLVAVMVGGDSIFVDQARFFAGTTLVTFGGAYAVLAHVARHAVRAQWLLPNEMIKGLAMAETTPGPLIQVVQFVAFVGAFRQPGSLNPWVAGVLAATLVTWVTYVPCFLFVFVGAPYVERLRGNAALQRALTAITAAIVGVIANLAIYFSLHTLFSRVENRRWGWAQGNVPMWSTISPRAVAVTLFAFVLAFKLRWSVGRLLLACGVFGAVLYGLANAS